MARLENTSVYQVNVGWTYRSLNGSSLEITSLVPSRRARVKSLMLKTYIYKFLKPFHNNIEKHLNTVNPRYMNTHQEFFIMSYSQHI